MNDKAVVFNCRSIRYKGYDYNQPGGYFVTIVAYQHKFIFGKINNKEMILFELGKIAQSCWQQIPRHFPKVEIEPFEIMPNHIHGIITIVEDDRRGTIYRAPTDTHVEFGKPIPGSLATIIRVYKVAVSR
jgi:putative transposase